MPISIFLSAFTEMIRFAKDETPLFSLSFSLFPSPIYYFLVLTLSCYSSPFFSLSISLRLTKLKKWFANSFQDSKRKRFYERVDILNRAPNGFVLSHRLPGHPLDFGSPSCESFLMSILILIDFFSTSSWSLHVIMKL